jgi:hypothetical protein
MIGGFMNHSKGPFTVESGSKGQLYIFGNEGYDPIAEMLNLRENTEGNAHLLAASYLMEKALQRTVMEGRHASYCSGNGLHGRLKTLRCDCFMKDVLRAISSAKGEGVWRK